MRRQVLAKLSWLVDLVFGEYDLRKGDYLTCGEFSEKVKILNNKHTAYGPALRRFLGKQQKDQKFDAVVFREFWEKNCKKLSEAEWQEQYPEG